MGAKTALLLHVDRAVPSLLGEARQLDLDATTAFMAASHPGWTGKPTRRGSLADFLYPPAGFVYAGSFPGVDILCDRRVMIERPSQLSTHLLRAGQGNRTVLHTMHSGSDWFAYAIWEDGSLLRSLSLSPTTGIVEDIGDRLPFEEPFWAGQRPVQPMTADDAPYPLPFHPLELGGEAALRELVGFVIEGRSLDTDVDADEIPLAGYPIPEPTPVSRADVDEFVATHKLVRRTLS